MVASGQSTRFTVGSSNVATLYENRILLSQNVVFEGRELTATGDVLLTAQAKVDILAKGPVAITTEGSSVITAKGDSTITAEGDTTVSTNGKLFIQGGEGTFYPLAAGTPLSGAFGDFWSSVCVAPSGGPLDIQLAQGTTAIKTVFINNVPNVPQTHVCSLYFLICSTVNPTEQCTLIPPSSCNGSIPPGTDCGPIPVWAPLRSTPLPLPWFIPSYAELIAGPAGLSVAAAAAFQSWPWKN